MGTLDYLSDNLIELRGPVDVAQDAAISNASTVTAYLYDTKLDTAVEDYSTVTTVDAAAAATSLTVQDDTPFQVGEICAVWQDDGTIHLFTITALPGSAVLTFSGDALPAAVSAGARVDRRTLTTASTYLSVQSWANWQEGDAYELTDDSGGVVTGTLTRINRDRNYALMSTSPAANTTRGAAVKSRVGAQITLTSFGSFPASAPEVGDSSWGFRGTIQSTHAGLRPGMRVRGEISLDDGAGLLLVRKVVATVINE